MTEYEAILLDIEGTTTSISFVYDVLFPFARERVDSFLATHWNDPDVQRDIELLRLQSRDDAREELEGVVEIPQGDRDESLDAVVESFLWQMDNDRKTSGLKSLQGKIWRDGYESGQLQAHLFDDVLPAFERWTDQRISLYIYSSGSVQAQKLLFGHTEAGDLTPMIAGYFDTLTGPKTEAEAASAAGFEVVVMVRPGNAELEAHDFETRSSFDEI